MGGAQEGMNELAPDVPAVGVCHTGDAVDADSCFSVCDIAVPSEEEQRST